MVGLSLLLENNKKQINSKRKDDNIIWKDSIFIFWVIFVEDKSWSQLIHITVCSAKQDLKRKEIRKGNCHTKNEKYAQEKREKRTLTYFFRSLVAFLVCQYRYLFPNLNFTIFIPFISTGDLVTSNILFSNPVSFYHPHKFSIYLLQGTNRFFFQK